MNPSDGHELESKQLTQLISSIRNVSSSQQKANSLSVLLRYSLLLEKHGKHFEARPLFKFINEMIDVSDFIIANLFNSRKFAEVKSFVRDLVRSNVTLSHYKVTAYLDSLLHTAVDSEDARCLAIFLQNKEFQVLVILCLSELHLNEDLGKAFSWISLLDEKTNSSKYFSLYTRISYQILLRDLAGFSDDSRRCGLASPSPKTSKLSIACSSLENYGRLGHVLYEYVFLKRLAEQESLDLHTPNWVGRYIFSLHDPVYNPELFNPVKHSFQELLNIKNSLGVSFLDRQDFFSPGGGEWNSDMYAYSRKLYRFDPLILRWLDNLLSSTISGKNILVAHLRFGDQDGLITTIDTKVITEYIINVMAQNPETLVFIVGDDLQKASLSITVPHLTTTRLLDRKLKGLSWVVDFYLITIAKWVICSQSAFSYWGCILSTASEASFVQPDVRAGQLISFCPVKLNVTEKVSIK